MNRASDDARRMTLVAEAIAAVLPLVEHDSLREACNAALKTLADAGYKPKARTKPRSASSRRRLLREMDRYKADTSEGATPGDASQ